MNISNALANAGIIQCYTGQSVTIPHILGCLVSQQLYNATWRTRHAMIIIIYDIIVVPRGTNAVTRAPI